MNKFQLHPCYSIDHSGRKEVGMIEIESRGDTVCNHEYLDLDFEKTNDGGRWGMYLVLGVVVVGWVMMVGFGGRK